MFLWKPTKDTGFSADIEEQEPDQGETTEEEDAIARYSTRSYILCGRLMLAAYFLRIQKPGFG